MVAVIVTASDGKKLFASSFENLSESIGYLKYLEARETEYYAQIGFVGFEKKNARTEKAEVAN